MDIQKAKRIMDINFIGPNELERVTSKLGIINPNKLKSDIPIVPFNEQELEKICKDHILILGMNKAQDNEKLTLNKLRSHLGYDPTRSEPCFYDQDWYLKEKFAMEKTLDFKWYVIKKDINEKTRGKTPEYITKKLETNEKFPSAILTTFVFFANYTLTNEILWKHDFIWCSDLDENGDKIYTGRYIDPKGINKNGFNIHRHLSIRPCYGMAPEVFI